MRERRRRAKPQAAIKPIHGMMFVGGLVAVCVGVLTLEPAIHTTGIVLHRAGYLPADFQVERSVRSKHGPNLRGRLLPDGSEVEADASQFDEVWTGGAGSVVRRLKDSEELRGALLPVWHNEAVPQFWQESRILSRKRYPALPTPGAAVGAALLPTSVRGCRSAHPMAHPGTATKPAEDALSFGVAARRC